MTLTTDIVIVKQAEIASNRSKYSSISIIELTQAFLKRTMRAMICRILIVRVLRSIEPGPELLRGPELVLFMNPEGQDDVVGVGGT